MGRSTRLWFEYAWMPGGWAQGVAITVTDGVIARVEPGAPTNPADGGGRGLAALPGLGNVHSHTFQRAMAGLAEVAGPEGGDFWSWRAWMYRFLDRLDPDDVEAVAAQAFVEMLERGFTRVGEFHYLHHDPAGAPYADLGETAGRIVAAAQATGIGLTLLPTYYAQGGFGGAPPAAGQRRFLNDPDRFAALLERSRAVAAALPDAVVGVAPHSLRAVSPQDLQAVLALAPSGPVHIHVAEQAKEVADALAWSGARPVAWLLDHAPVDARWCLIHATHLSEAEGRALAASAAVVGLCPVTEANLGDGVFPARDHLAAGGRIGVGTDSNVAIDAAGELRLLEYAQRLTRRARNVLAGGEGASTGATLLRRALEGGAQALGVRAGLEVGAPADIVALSTRADALVGRAGDAWIDGWLFAGCGREIDSVWRRGERVVEGGRHVAREAIAARYARTLERLLAA